MSGSTNSMVCEGGRSDALLKSMSGRLDQSFRVRGEEPEVWPVTLEEGWKEEQRIFVYG